MKNLVVLFLLFSTFTLVAQESTSNAKSKWIIGFGANFIDNTATKNGKYINASDQWNLSNSLRTQVSSVRRVRLAHFLRQSELFRHQEFE